MRSHRPFRNPSILLTCAAVLAACAGADVVVDHAGRADAGETPPDAGDACAPARAWLVSTQPERGAEHVDPTMRLALGIALPLDSSSITTESVALFAPHATRPVAATVSWDEVRSTITLAPIVPLAPGATYRVRLNGLTSRDCGTLPEAHWTFRTNTSVAVRVENLTASGSLHSGQLNEVDARGRITAIRLVSSVGSDGLLGTSDDAVSLEERLAWLDRADGASTLVISLAGPDGVLDTADDEIGDVVDVSDDPEAQQTLTMHRTPGTDGVSLTEDDGYGLLERQTWAADGSPLEEAHFTDPGPDGLPFTADDPLEYLTRLDAATGRKRLIADPGPDATWDTPDDAFSYFDLRTDAFGRVRGTLHYTNGADALPLTADDVVSQAFVNLFAADTGLPSGVLQLSGLGPDGEWNTADDVVFAAATYEYDAHGNRTAETHAYPGLDRVPFTADDVVFKRVRRAVGADSP